MLMLMLNEVLIHARPPAGDESAVMALEEFKARLLL